MENKERLNLNPEAEDQKVQEENAASEMDAINNEETNLPEETQDTLLNEKDDNVVAEKAIETVVEPVAIAESINELGLSNETEPVNEPEPVKEPDPANGPEPIITTEPLEPVVVAAPLQNEITGEQDAHAQIHQELLDINLESVVAEDEEDEEEEDGSDLNYESFNREQLVDLLEKAVSENDIALIKKKVANIRIEFEKLNKTHKEAAFKKYMDEGGEAEAYAPIDDVFEQRFKMAFDKFKQIKARFNEEQEKAKTNNLILKNQILEGLRVLIDSEEPLKKINDDFKVLQDSWKSIGMVPKNEVTALWNNYHFLVEKFYDKIRIIKELKDLDLRKNLEAKISICEKAEDLLVNFTQSDSFKKLQQLHEEWKEIGPVPLDKKDEVWERFKAASDQINDRRREYYTGMQEEQNNNYAAKVALCESAEKLIGGDVESVKQWQDITDQLNELLKVWKSVGPAPRKVNDEVWTRFKGYLDAFFANKKDFFTKLKEQQLNNYNLKLNLCVQAESLMSSNDWSATTKELIRLQKEWKNIGPVPRKQSDKIWKRFRAACDEFFNQKSEFFKHIHHAEDENLELKLSILKQVQELVLGEDRNANIEILKDFQRQWLEIGHVPIKDKDKLQNDFRNAVNKHFDTLKMNSQEVSSTNYKQKFESMKDQPEANKIISRERLFLQNKMTKLQEDIKIWENNIGFFANSKNSNMYKAEFEQKIEKAKEELKGIEAKIKILRTV